MADAACSIAGTLTITATSQTSTLTACPTFTGSIELAEPLSGAFNIESTLEVLEGDLNITSIAGLTSLIFTTLEHLNGSLTVSNVEQLASLDFPALQDIGTLTLANPGPALQALAMPELAKAIRVAIYGTALTDLSGLAGLQTIGGAGLTGVQSGLDIHENTALRDISLPALASNDGAIYIFGNNDSTEFASVSFPELVSTGSVDIAQTASLLLPKLQNASLEIHDNPTLSILELPALEDSRNLTIVNNPLLSSLQVPLLKTVESAGGQETIDGVIYNMTITINSGDALTVVEFPALTTISGGVELNGTFTNITLPLLTSSTGPFLLNSTSPLINTTCAHLSTLNTTSATNPTRIINGDLLCTYPGSDEHSTSSHGKSNEGAKIGGGVGGTVAFFVLAALAILGWFYYRMIRKRNERRRVDWGAQEGVELR